MADQTVTETDTTDELTQEVLATIETALDEEYDTEEKASEGNVHYFTIPREDVDVEFKVTVEKI